MIITRLLTQSLVISGKIFEEWIVVLNGEIRTIPETFFLKRQPSSFSPDDKSCGLSQDPFLPHSQAQKVKLKFVHTLG